ncbi:nitrous oxide-stimulated promoter family protein [Vibrio parahaemolyticus]
MSSKLLVGALATEFKTVSSMIDVYCQAHHKTIETCDHCKTLKEYAEIRLDRCPYGGSKPTCNKCPIHCYKKTEKEQMRLVMRYSGPRMLLTHPILAVRHLIHERKSVPDKIIAKNSNRHKRLARTGDERNV